MIYVEVAIKLLNTSNKSLPVLKRKYPDLKFGTYACCTQRGKKNILRNSNFDYVESIHELDDSYKCFIQIHEFLQTKTVILILQKLKNLEESMENPFGRKLLLSKIPKWIQFNSIN